MEENNNYNEYINELTEQLMNSIQNYDLNDIIIDLIIEDDDQNLLEYRFLEMENRFLLYHENQSIGNIYQYPLKIQNNNIEINYPEIVSDIVKELLLTNNWSDEAIETYCSFFHKQCIDYINMCNNISKKKVTEIIVDKVGRIKFNSNVL